MYVYLVRRIVIRILKIGNFKFFIILFVCLCVKLSILSDFYMYVKILGIFFVLCIFFFIVKNDVMCLF